MRRRGGPRRARAQPPSNERFPAAGEQAGGRAPAGAGPASRPAAQSRRGRPRAAAGRTPRPCRSRRAGAAPAGPLGWPARGARPRPGRRARGPRPQHAVEEVDVEGALARRPGPSRSSQPPMRSNHSAQREVVAAAHVPRRRGPGELAPRAGSYARPPEGPVARRRQRQHATTHQRQLRVRGERALELLDPAGSPRRSRRPGPRPAASSRAGRRRSGLRPGRCRRPRQRRAPAAAATRACLGPGSDPPRRPPPAHRLARSDSRQRASATRPVARGDRDADRACVVTRASAARART